MCSHLSQNNSCCQQVSSPETVDKMPFYQVLIPVLPGALPLTLWHSPGLTTLLPLPPDPELPKGAGLSFAQCCDPHVELLATLQRLQSECTCSSGGLPAGSVQKAFPGPQFTLCPLGRTRLGFMEFVRRLCGQGDKMQQADFAKLKNFLAGTISRYNPRSQDGRCLLCT